MFIQEDKNLISDAVDESQNKTDKFMDEINAALFAMLSNPTEEQIKKFRDTRDALLVGWLAAILGDALPNFYKSAQIGIDKADEQLKALDITEIVNKAINKKTFTEKIDNNINSLNQDLQYISEAIKANSERIIKEIKTKPVANTAKEQKKISTQLVSELKEKGITFFTDKIGRKIPIEKYIKMRVFTDTVKIQRTTFFVRAIQYGVDLVRIVHLNTHPTCELCAPFENKILSISGKTAEYMTIEEAENYGLFHPNCDHVPDNFQLVKEPSQQDNKIKLSEANEKRFEYNTKKSVI